MKNPFSKALRYTALPYRQDVYVATSKKQWARMYEYLTHEKPDMKVTNGCFTHLVNEKTGTPCFILGWFNGEYETLVHECVHACFHILELVGIKSEAGENEAFAYLHGHMWTEIAKLVAK